MELLRGSGREDGEAANAYLVFQIETRRYGLPVAVVSEVLPACAIDPLPGGGEAIAGAITLRGRMIPVLASRPYLGHATRGTLPQDHFLLAELDGRTLVVPCDRALGLAVLTPDDAAASELIHDCDHIAAVARDEQGLVLIPRLTGCLPQRAAA